MASRDPDFLQIRSPAMAVEHLSGATLFVNQDQLQAVFYTGVPDAKELKALKPTLGPG